MLLILSFLSNCDLFATERVGNKGPNKEGVKPFGINTIEISDLNLPEWFTTIWPITRISINISSKKKGKAVEAEVVFSSFKSNSDATSDIDLKNISYSISKIGKDRFILKPDKVEGSQNHFIITRDKTPKLGLFTLDDKINKDDPNSDSWVSFNHKSPNFKFEILKNKIIAKFVYTDDGERVEKILDSIKAVRS